MPIGLMEQLVHCTVRIVITREDGSKKSGTGFFMNFLQNGDAAMPVIVSNKHVIEGAVVGTLALTLKLSNGEPDIGNHKEFQINEFESKWVLHPDERVDLAVFPIGSLLNSEQQKGTSLFYTSLSTALIPTNDERAEYSTMEDIIMIGYPTGIWDEKNNLPVIRKGITATHCAIDWNGNPEFLTDIATFPGSSGSPVLLANIGGYVDRYGNTNLGSPRIKLIGIHCDGTLFAVQNFEECEVTSTNSPQNESIQIPNNIGIVINSSRILELEKILGDRESHRILGIRNHLFDVIKTIVEPKVQPLRNSICKCGTGKKFKNCCGLVS